MRAIALLGVFLIAKLLVLVGHSVPISGWTPIAYLWQDLLVAIIFLALDAAIKRPRVSWLLYGSAVVYIALNVAIARVLSSPLTWPMMKAVGGALSDSIRHHATFVNLGSVVLVITAGTLLPILLKGIEPKRPGPYVIAATLVVLLGPTATSSVDTIGLHRNALAAIVTSSLPRSSANAAAGGHRDWRESPFEGDSRSEGLEHLQGASAGRNVLLVLLESTGAAYLKPYGSRLDPMPRLTEFARRAVVFEAAYAVYPESIKTLFSILSGRYPTSVPVKKSDQNPTSPSLAARLKEGGYQTALFHSGRFMYLGMEHVVRDRGYDVLEDAGEIGGQRESSFGVDEPSTVRRMLAWIDAMPRSQQFFLTYLPIAGHHPYDTPEPGPFPEREEPERYLNALNYADASLDGLIEGLRSRGLAEKTLFVIAGDHGEAFGQHEGNYGHSLFIYDENVRVPYFIAAPGLIGKELRVRQPVSLIDMTPTILDLLGLEIPEGYQGSSMLDGRNQMSLFFTDYSLSLFGLRDGCWKYIYESGTQRSKLFNLCDDARESRDLADEHRERVNVYKARLADWGARQSSW